jgi:hypothetical protein
MIKPVRFYLILLFVAVAGVGTYLLTRQANEDYDTANQMNGQDLREASTSATPTPTPAASAAATTGTTSTIKVDTEASELESLISSISEDDFSDSELGDSSIGL